MTALSHSSSAELAVLLSQLSEQVQQGGDADETQDAPTPSEAMALYFVATRLVELQLQLLEHGDKRKPAGRSESDQSGDIAVTREVLEGTRAVLRASLERMDEESSGESGHGAVSPLIRNRRQRKRARHPNGG